MAQSRALQNFEKRTAETNKKLTQMNSELMRAQEHARRLQDLLGGERRKQKAFKVSLFPMYYRSGLVVDLNSRVN